MINPYDRFHADIAIGEADADRMSWSAGWKPRSATDSPMPPSCLTRTSPRRSARPASSRALGRLRGLKLAQPVLSAVSPRHKGWYVRIISELDEHLRDIGAEHSFLITQLTNNAVIRWRSWATSSAARANTSSARCSDPCARPSAATSNGTRPALLKEAALIAAERVDRVMVVADSAHATCPARPARLPGRASRSRRPWHRSRATKPLRDRST